MKQKARVSGFIAGALTAAILAGCVSTSSLDPTSAAATAATDVPTASDLQSDDRSLTSTPLLDIPLDTETQWEIYDLCDQDPALFSAVMAIAQVETHYTTDKIGDDGQSVGMFQINTRWHTDRMERLGVTDLTDPVQCASVAIDYLEELETGTGATLEDDTLYMSYNMGATGARKAIAAGTESTTYSRAVLEAYRDNLAELEAE